MIIYIEKEQRKMYNLEILFRNVYCKYAIIYYGGYLCLSLYVGKQ